MCYLETFTKVYCPSLSNSFSMKNELKNCDDSRELFCTQSDVSHRKLETIIMS